MLDHYVHRLESGFVRNQWRQLQIVLMLMLILSLILFLLSHIPITTPSHLHLASPPRALHHDQTIAIASFNGPNRTLDSCELMLAESHKKHDKTELIKRLSVRYKIEKIDLPTMMAVIDQCHTLEAGISRQGGEDKDEEMVEKNDQEALKLFKGILPGTLWCGFDDIAPNYFALGPSKQLDSCCRTHDHCPMKVKAFRSRYGVMNLAPYTKNYCACDQSFYDCLKSIGSAKADEIGEFFFNTLQIQCLQMQNCTRARGRRTIGRRDRSCSGKYEFRLRSVNMHKY